MARKLGVITSGGDCGGLNAVVKGAAHMANSLGMSLYVIPNGYAGLYNLVEFDQLVELNESRVDPVNIGLAGSEAGHSRVKIGKIADDQKYDRIKKGLEKFGIDGLVISGGDDTGSVIVDLDKHGIKCVHAPKTMDLDLQTYSVGGDSAINRIADFASDIKTTGQTHNRIIIIEVFGRYAGHTAFRGGIAGDVDAILIPEVPVDFDVLYRHVKKVFCRRITESDIRAGTYVIVVAEGMRNASGEELYDESVPADAFGHRKLAGAGRYVSQEMTKRLKADPEIQAFMKKTGMYVPRLYEIPEAREIVPTHLVRCGFTSAYDANFGMEAGAGAVLLLSQGHTGVTVVGVNGTKVLYMRTAEVIKQRYVDSRLISLYEHLGFCFGREPEVFKPEFEEVSGTVSRIY